jgi:purine-binding chemotaxis protein CheW
MNVSAGVSTSQVLHFYMQDVYACIDLQFIKKVLALPQLEPVPINPDYFVGLMNCAGVSIPIIDLAWFIHLETHESYTLDTPIILCSDGTRHVGFIIDKIIGISTIDKAQLQERHDSLNSVFLTTLTLNAKLALLVDMNYVLGKILSISNKTSCDIPLG